MSAICWGLAKVSLAKKQDRWSPHSKEEEGDYKPGLTNMCYSQPGLSPKVLISATSVKKQSWCQWPTHDAWLLVLLTCLSCRVWNALSVTRQAKVHLLPRWLGHIKMDPYSFPQMNIKFSHEYLSLIKVTFSC
jgi:hypothetical protein